MLNCFVADFFGLDESSALTVKVEVPAAVGVPEIAPEEMLRVKPVGIEPAKTEKRYG